MEGIAESKRVASNNKLLEKSGNSSNISLEEYCKKSHGVMFGDSSILDVLSHMKSDGKVPLKMSAVCQPVMFPPAPGIIWQSACVSIREEPRIQTPGVESLYSTVRSKSNTSMKNTFETIIPGALCIWKDPRSVLLAKESIVFFKIDFHDGVNFFALYTNEHRFKRIGSISIDQFLKTSNRFNFETNEIVFDGSKVIDKIRVSDQEIFLGLAMLYCYSEKR